MGKDNLKGKTQKGLYWTFLNQFVTYGMQFVIGIIMARMLSPEDYGITALPAVFISIAAIFVDCGFGNALIRKPNLSEQDLSTAFYYSIIIGVVCYVILFFASSIIASFYATPIIEKLMRITALTFLWAPLATPQRILLNRRLDFKTSTKINITTRLIAGIIGISVAYYGYGIWALVISSLISSMLDTFLNWFIVRWLPSTKWSKESFRYLWGYGNKLMASSFLNALFNNITPIFIGKFYSKSELGVYNRALGYANLPSQNFTQAIRSVTFPVLSKIQDDTERLVYNYRRMLKVMCFVVFPMMLILAGLAKPIIILMLTEKWIACIPLLQILCFSQMWYPLAAINLNLLQVKGRSDLFLRLEIIKKGIMLVVMFITLPIGVEAFCYGCVVASILDIGVNTYYTGKLIKVGFIRQLKDVSTSLSASLLIFFFLINFIKITPNVYFQIFGGTIISGILYLGISYTFRFSELNDLKFILNRNK